MSQLIPSTDDMKTLSIMAQQAGKSKFFEKLGGVEGCTCIALMAFELNVPIMTALSGGIRFILGKVELSPQLMNMMIRNKGHKLEIIESSDKKCIIKGTRSDTGEFYTCTFSLEDAKKANLIKAGSGWEKYPEDMCFARCISRLSRRLFPDVIGSAYVEGEISNEPKKYNYDAAPYKPAESEKPTMMDIVDESPITDQQCETLTQLKEQIIDKTFVSKIEDRIQEKFEVLSWKELPCSAYEMIKGTLESKISQQKEVMDGSAIVA